MRWRAPEPAPTWPGTRAALAAPLELVAKSPEGSAELRLARPGPRARPCVADWNEDGRLDLVLGEHSGEDGAAPELDEAQQAALQASLRIGMDLGLRRGELERAALARWLEQKHIPLDEASKHYDVFLLEWLKTDEALEIVARQQQQIALQRRLNPSLRVGVPAEAQGRLTTRQAFLRARRWTGAGRMRVSGTRAFPAPALRFCSR